MNTKLNKAKSLVKFFFEVGTLRKLARAHRQVLLTDDLSDSIASHSYRVSVIGYFLAMEEKIDANKVLKMCLIHDTGESRSNDHNWVHKKYIHIYDDEIVEGQLSFLPKDHELIVIAKEYEDRKTPESKVAKDADLLDQMLLLREYEWQGNKEAASWLAGKSNQEKLLYSKTAKKLAREIKRQKPSEWWDNLWTSKRR